jgi:hypothetical protein
MVYIECLNDIWLVGTGRAVAATTRTLVGRMATRSDTQQRFHSMSDAASPCPDASTAVTPAAPTESSQLSGIRELVRIAELQALAYAQAAARAESGGSGAPSTDPPPAGLPDQAASAAGSTVPEQRQPPP